MGIEFHQWVVVVWIGHDPLRGLGTQNVIVTRHKNFAAQSETPGMQVRAMFSSRKTQSEQ